MKHRSIDLNYLAVKSKFSKMFQTILTFLGFLLTLHNQENSYAQYVYFVKISAVV